MDADLRGTPEFAVVTEHFRRLHEPGFGRPHALREPDVSPDGSRVAVTGVVLDELVGHPRTAVYTAEDGALRPVSADGGSSRWPRFSPDGRSLAFLSDRSRSGVFQLCLLDSGRLGEAVAAPAVPGTVEYAHWSPDGRTILLGVAGLGSELSGGQGSGTNVHAEEDRPDWQPLVIGGADENAWRSLWLYTVETGAATRLSPEGTNCWEAGWCGPDRVVAVTSGAYGEDAWYTARLTLIDAASGEARDLLGSDVQFGMPVGSPDGARVAVVQAVCSDRGLVAGDVTVVDVASGERTVLDGLGADVTRLQWIDETTLGYLGLRRLQSVAGTVDVTTGAATEIFATDLACGGATFHPDGAFTADGRVLTVQEAYDLPPRLALCGGEADRVLGTVANSGTDYLLGMAGKAAQVSWTASDGLEIEGVLCVPDGAGPFPLIVNIHGGPIWSFRTKWSMGYPWIPLMVSRGYAVLNPNPRGSSGRGQDFARRVVGDMGGADAHDILSGIDALVERGVADPARIGLIGGSYGGFMSSWLVTLDSRFAASVPMSPVTDWFSQSFTSNVGGWGLDFLRADPEDPGSAVATRSPVLRASRVRTPCLIFAGTDDRCTPPGQAREFHQALARHGAESRLVVYPGEGHGVRAYPALLDQITRVTQWFHHHMPA